MTDHTRARLRSLGLSAALAIALAACSSASTGAPTAESTSGAASGSAATPSAATGSAATGSAASTTATGAASAKIVDFGFDPASLTVKVGAAVTWTNSGSATHTVTADDGSFDSGPVASGGVFQQAFSKAGTFAYHCKIHPSMKGTVVVTP